MPSAGKKIQIYGEVLQKGIWIYIAEVKRFGKSQFFYVGKTGRKKGAMDTSPLSRLAAHLDDEAGSNNCLLHHVKMAKLDIAKCTLELSCFGPDLFKLAGVEARASRHEIIEEAEAQVAIRIKKVRRLRGKHKNRHPSHKVDAKTIADYIINELKTSYIQGLE